MANKKSAKKKKKSQAQGSASIVLQGDVSGPVFWVTVDRVIETGEHRSAPDIVRHPGSVVVLAVDETGQEPHILLECSTATQWAGRSRNCRRGG